MTAVGRRAGPLLLAVCSALLAATVVAATALAQDAGSGQRDLLRKAQAAESAAQPKQALTIHRRALAADPRSRLARRIRARLSWLEARSEGDYRPLAAWLRIRERPTSLAELREFVRQAERFPTGRVRRDSWALAANALLRRFKLPREALVAYQRWAAEPNLDDAERQLALSGVALSRAQLGQLDESIEQLDRAGLSRRPEARFLRAQRIASACCC